MELSVVVKQRQQRFQLNAFLSIGIGSRSCSRGEGRLLLIANDFFLDLFPMTNVFHFFRLVQSFWSN
jgi:hypothetical protein